METTFIPPPFDPELEAVIESHGGVLAPTVTPDMIEEMRALPWSEVPIEDLLSEAGVLREDVMVAGHEGDEIRVSVLRRRDHVGPGPGIYFIHGGGMILGDPFAEVSQFLPWITEFDAVVVTVEYRLAPEFPDPYPVRDCYSGLRWMGENLESLDIAPERLLIAGTSAGGGLAAGVTLLVRDQGGPPLAGQVLTYPMLDDRDATVSARQPHGASMWDRASNVTGWSALLGERRGTEDVSIYAAPARATDLAGLPPAYVDCGSAEVFRDEDVAYATALWHAGVPTELHVWPGGFHAFDLVAPHTELAKAMAAARTAWIARVLRSRG